MYVCNLLQMYVLDVCQPLPRRLGSFPRTCIVKELQSSPRLFETIKNINKNAVILVIFNKPVF